MKVKYPLFTLLAAAPLLYTACGDDRSGEQPFAPTVKSVSAVADGDSALLTGFVTSSPNSTLKKCGFVYGNDTLRKEKASETAGETFGVMTDSLGAGDYYAVAYAQNGVGKGYGDTLRFTISASAVPASVGR